MDEKTLMKMIVVRSTDRVVGMHMAGSDAPEIIQGMAVAIRAGATKAVFDSTIGIHPTAAEEFVTLREAGGLSSMNTSVHRASCRETYHTAKTITICHNSVGRMSTRIALRS